MIENKDKPHQIATHSYATTNSHYMFDLDASNKNSDNHFIAEVCSQINLLLTANSFDPIDSMVYPQYCMMLNITQLRQTIERLLTPCKSPKDNDIIWNINDPKCGGLCNKYLQDNSRQDKSQETTIKSLSKEMAGKEEAKQHDIVLISSYKGQIDELQKDIYKLQKELSLARNNVSTLKSKMNEYKSNNDNAISEIV